MTEISERQIDIIQATGKILTDTGVAGLTIKKLAAAMQFSESAIYRHFESKEAILVAMLRFLNRNINQRLSIICVSEENEETKLTIIFKSQFNFFNENKHFLIAVFSDGLMQESEQINNAILGLMKMKSAHLLPIIIRGQTQNIFTNAIDANAILHIILGSFRLQMLKWKIANFNFDIETEGNKMIQSILILIKK
jgi:AcrR family transcriptional regulator